MYIIMHIVYDICMINTFFRHHFNMFILVAFSQDSLPVSTSQALLRRMVAQDAAGRASEALQDSGFGCNMM